MERIVSVRRHLHAPGTFESRGLCNVAGAVRGFLGQGANFRPWDVSWNGGGFTFSDFYQTRRVPEPATLALVALAVAGLGFSRRKAS